MDLANPFTDSSLGRRYEGKAAIVTGAASGIGKATAIRLAAEGAAVMAADVNEGGLAETVSFIHDNKGNAKSRSLDVTDPAECAAIVAETVEQFGALDVVCNIAGIGGSTHTLDEKPERLQAMLAVNAMGPFYLCQAAIPHLLETKGNIVNLASTAGIIGQAYCTAYCASKHALVGITKSLAIEYGRQGIRINAVCPGGVNTNILSGFMPPEDASMSLISRSYLTIEMQEPESVAAMVAYVGSDEAYYVNGAILSIDAGTTTG